MESSLHARSACAARSISSAMSIPTSAAGNKPKIESAEYRPPTLGSPGKIASHPSRCACASNSEPGSVIATKCRTISSSGKNSFSASRNACNIRRGSIVPPLFDEIITSVEAGLILPITSRKRTGESESSVRNRMEPELGLLYLVIVIDACVEPPWPISTTSVTLLRRASCANAIMRSRGYGGFDASVVQPIYSCAIACASGEKLYTVAS